MTATKKICLGAFAGAHGVNGVARIKTFTDNPRDIGAYGPVSTRDGSRAFTLTIVRVAENGVVHVSAPEIQSREDAKALSGT
ncbi:MAG: ribosome maturation factor RimM, partial [Pseudomonadota bacterium]